MATLQEERDILFDENFKSKTNDKLKMIRFCAKLKEITGVQVCNYEGMAYEYLQTVYNSAVKRDEM